MLDSPKTTSQKSTIVRTRRLRVLAVGAGLKVVGRVAPAVADRWAARLFFTPMGRPRAFPPTVVGLEAEPFHLGFGRGRLAGWAWGRGPTVLLAHGWAGHAGQMCRIASHLTARGYRVVAFDMPAHGDSDGEQTTFVEMAAAVEAVAATTGPLAGIVAHSLGATAAVLAVGEGVRCDRLVMLAPAADPGFFVGRALRELRLSGERAEGVSREIGRRVARGGVVPSVMATVGRIEAPILVLHDPRDRDVPWEQGLALVQASRAGAMVPVRGVGHNRILDERRVVSAAAEFIARGPAATRGVVEKLAAAAR